MIINLPVSLNLPQGSTSSLKTQNSSEDKSSQNYLNLFPSSAQTASDFQLPDAPCVSRQTGGQLPEIQHQTGHHPWLGGLSLWDIIEKQFTVRDHGKRSLPALLHPARLRDLTERK